MTVELSERELFILAVATSYAQDSLGDLNDLMATEEGGDTVQVDGTELEGLVLGDTEVEDLQHTLAAKLIRKKYVDRLASAHPLLRIAHEETMAMPCGIGEE